MSLRVWFRDFALYIFLMYLKYDYVIFTVLAISISVIFSIAVNVCDPLLLAAMIILLAGAIGTLCVSYLYNPGINKTCTFADVPLQTLKIAKKIPVKEVDIFLSYTYELMTSPSDQTVTLPIVRKLATDSTHSKRINIYLDFDTLRNLLFRCHFGRLFLRQLLKTRSIVLHIVRTRKRLRNTALIAPRNSRYLIIAYLKTCPIDRKAYVLFGKRAQYYLKILRKIRKEAICVKRHGTELDLTDLENILTVLT